MRVEVPGASVENKGSAPDQEETQHVFLCSPACLSVFCPFL